MEHELTDAILASYIGAAVSCVMIEQWSIRLHFGKGDLFVEGPWVLLERQGQSIDWSMRLEDRQFFHLWRVLGSTLISAYFPKANDQTIRFKFANGMELNVLATEGPYEDWSLASPLGQVYSIGHSIAEYDP